MSWFSATSAIQKLAVLPSLAPVSTDSQPVASVPPAEQLVPFQLEPAPTQAFTPARWIVPSCWWPVEGLSTVKVIDEVVPGYGVVPAVPCSVRVALVPT